MATVYKYGTYGHIGETVAQSVTETGTVVVYVGTAPVNLVKGYAGAGVIDAPVKISGMSDAQKKLGYSPDWASFTLGEAVAAHYDNANDNIGPFIAINVLDPDVHRAANQTAVNLTFTNGRAEIISDKIILDTFTLTGYTEGTDYSAEYNYGKGAVVITSLKPDVPITGTIAATYYEVDATLVDAADIIGSATDDGKYTGLGALQLVYQTSFDITNLLAAPGWSQLPDVYNAMVAACQQINGHWNAFVLADIPLAANTPATPITQDIAVTDGVATATINNLDVTSLQVFADGSDTPATVTTDYTADYTGGVLTITIVEDGALNGETSITIKGNLAATTDTIDTIDSAIQWKSENAYTSELSKVCWPMAADSRGRNFHISTLTAVTMLRTDTENDAIPMETPGNKQIPIVKLYFGAGSTNQGYDQVRANLLTSNGITTAIAGNSMWVIWGDHTAAYVFGQTVDPRVIFDVSMRMLMYITNSFQREWWPAIDEPMTRQLVERILNREQEKLDALVTQGALIGEPVVQFVQSENPQSEIMLGNFRWDILVTPTPPLKSATVYVAYTDAGFSVYFSDGGEG